MINIYKNKINTENYIVVEYYLEAISGSTLNDCAWAIALGQSVGNPNVRSVWETEKLFEDHCCIILDEKKRIESQQKGKIKIAFPISNINLKEDGITQLLVQIMGGQLDIDLIKVCHILDVSFPKSAEAQFLKPKFGIEGIRDYTKCFNKPLLGGIVKPKVGIDPSTLLEVVKELVEGGVNFIKEDEIMSNPNICPIDERVPLIMDYLKDKDVIYAVCISADAPYLYDRVKRVHELGGNAVHVNFWSGLGAYKAIREMDLPLFLFFQKSGDSILTNPLHNHHIEWNVICKLAGLMGVDFIHAGMWGGYLNTTEKNLQETINILLQYNVMPSLSCGMHPGLIETVNEKFGIEYMANCGGSIHGHPAGTLAGAKALRQAIDGTPGAEYKAAIEKWGKI